jgi:hypothetical protein
MNPNKVEPLVSNKVEPLVSNKVEPLVSNKVEPLVSNKVEPLVSNKVKDSSLSNVLPVPSPPEEETLSSKEVKRWETFKNQCLQRLRDYATDDEISQFRPLDSPNFGPRLPEEVCFRPVYFAAYNPVFLFTDKETRTRMWRIRNLVLVSSGIPNIDPTYNFVESPDSISTFFTRYDTLPTELKITLNFTLENSPDVRAVVYEVPIEIAYPGGNPKKKSRQPPTLKLVSLEDLIRVDKYTPNQISYLSNFMFAPSFLLPYGFVWMMIWTLHLDSRSFTSGLGALERPLTRAQSKWISGDHPYFHPSPKLIEFAAKFFCLYLDIPFPTTTKGAKHIFDVFVVIMVKGFISPEDIDLAIPGPSKKASTNGSDESNEIEKDQKYIQEYLTKALFGETSPPEGKPPSVNPADLVNIAQGLQKVTSILAKGVTDAGGEIFTVKDDLVKVTCMSMPDLSSSSGNAPPSSGCKCQRCRTQERLLRKIEARKASK